MDLIFLGTSGATPTKERNLPSMAIRLDSGNILLFDAGEDVQRRFQEANLKFNVPTTIFISHLHGDHVIGLPGLLFNFHLNNRTEKLMIFGPPGLANYLMGLYQTIGLQAKNYNLVLNEIYLDKNPENQDKSFKDIHDLKDENISPITNQVHRLVHYEKFLTREFTRSILQLPSNQIFMNSEYSVLVKELNHSVFNLAYRINEAPRKGKFNPERANELHIPRSYYWNKMHNGETVTLRDGRTIDPVEQGIVSEKRPGRSITYSGDTGKSKNLIKIAYKSDYLVCESTYHLMHEQKAREKQHLTALDAGLIAKYAKVHHLILTHFSSRYDAVEIEEMQKQAEINHKSVLMAKDLLDLKISFVNNTEEEEK